MKLADDVEETHPLAAKILRQEMYVDDVLAGTHDLTTAKSARDELISALKTPGFALRKWTSNDPHILKGLPQDHLLETETLNLSEPENTKTLGIRWNSKKDSFFFLVNPMEKKPAHTKREVLSAIAKLFDPAGWLSPIIITAKIIMQQIWLDKTDWDESLKPLTLHRWNSFVKDYDNINKIEIPRWTHFNPTTTIEFHGFSDASEKAYAATLYIRVSVGDKIWTTLLVSKTRVAPIKTVSLPRLELCGAVLLANLVNSTLSQLHLTQYKSCFWTDSTIVLAWLNKPPCSWTTFVSHRVAAITEKVGVENWNHVESQDNPADLASRGCTPTDLFNCNLWWHGPQWLQHEKEHFPASEKTYNTTVEFKPVKTFAITTQEDILERFSSFPRAIRVIAYLFRFCANASPRRREIGYSNHEITPEEFKTTRMKLIIHTQKTHFREEYDALTRKTQIHKKSSLLTLNPFIDPKGVMRSDGRLTNSAALSYNERHPILLPYNSRLTKLLTQFTHLATLHGGNQLVLRLLRTEFWIPKAKMLIKTIIHQCKTCIIHNKAQQTQIMAALPNERTILTRPFAATGIDFAGPYDIKNYTGRACLITKGYICVFVCFSTKAIHLEPVSDLTTQAFLAAFSRFFSRLPS
ncbi:uncharacterized protein LOC120777820 [Bactrocera tryoni]|uniref:uncharacterized protein LOC120777820 n=1 Tax=Bactrocera tryoni TaxID=59916 RepID=UPI001A99DFDC|nr:uncharacterized protein LOC120777820 [Bactrocera tryoni]